MRKPTKVVVSLVDVSSIERDALKTLRKARPEISETHVGFKPHGFVETQEGLFALSCEGVGHGKPVTDEGPYVVSIYIGSTWGELFPAMEVSLGPGKLRELATGEKVNLAGFIRSFGSRLETNYEAWRTKLEEGA